ncbi:SDR family NAD(P)-dependent oxidoreductase [Granulicella cerasi]|uniref:SDR family NAD(P)-dependent oxidoreductase n=1 Tax=Granulicella cerasi TaxID=741063 RepID=A0ABW1ZBY7_9BACT|nr:SDR family oxidoreductase [Granulicella cerasi]
MDLQLKGRTAIVTGGSAGIGLAITKSLAAEGVIVTVPGRSKEKLDAALAGIPNVQPIVADVATAEGCEALIAAVPNTNILINNLGIYEAKEFANITDADWLKLFEVNVMSGVRLSRHYFPLMLAKNDGRIIFISSESGVKTQADMIHYGVTKSAQLAVSRGLAEATKGTRVTVNSILPGPTRSEGIVGFLQGLFPGENLTDAQAEQKFFEVYRNSSLLQRLIESEEVASLVAYVASPLSSATNGAALRVEGGLVSTMI